MFKKKFAKTFFTPKSFITFAQLFFRDERSSIPRAHF